VLAFDATCGTCRRISGAVEQACEGRLEVLPLADLDVRRWREETLGVDAEWAPTLLRVGSERVRAWTGPAMAAPLVRWLGPITTTVAAGLVLTGKTPAFASGTTSAVVGEIGRR